MGRESFSARFTNGQLPCRMVWRYNLGFVVLFGLYKLLLAGVASVLVGHPFDTVKVRLQTQAFGGPKYRGTFHCFASIVRQESVSH